MIYSGRLGSLAIAEHSDRLMLSHTGLKRFQERRRQGHPVDPLDNLLGLIKNHPLQRFPPTPHLGLALEEGWIEWAPPAISVEDVVLRGLRNPLEHVSRVSFEVTNRCNFACSHCRNDRSESATEEDIPRLIQAASDFLPLGIRRFDFIGGEVSRFGNGWLDVARHINETDSRSAWPTPLVVSLYTNGWWLEAKGFEAAGRTYAGEQDYLEDLRESGVTHVLFSIDGPEDRHDRWRGHPGLFARVLEGIPRVQEAGLLPRLSTIQKPGDDFHHLRPFAERIYRTKGREALDRFLTDPMNHRNNLVDTGRAESLREGVRSIHSMGNREARCKAFFRPTSLRVTASGNLGICPLMRGLEGYGSIRERRMQDLLNRLDEAPLYRLHASGGIGDYLAQLDPTPFSRGFDHRCSVVTALNHLALASQI